MALNRDNLKASALFVVLMFIAPASGLAASAKENFEWYCVQCHGSDGTGKGINSVKELPVGPMDLSNPKEMKKFTGEQIIKTLTHGGPVNTLDSLMPPWGNRLAKDEIKALMQYVRSLCKGSDCPK